MGQTDVTSLHERILTNCRMKGNLEDLGGKVIYDVIKRLEESGYTVSEKDAYPLTMAYERVRSIIRNECNVRHIPLGLRYVATDMVLGDFLMTKKTFDPDRLSHFDLSVAVKQIQTGDTNTVFAVGEGASLSPEQRLDAFIQHLQSAGRTQFSAFRRLRW